MNEEAWSLALRAHSPEPHPDEAAWERFAAGELAAAERDALLDHALQCGACAQALRAVQELATTLGRELDMHPPAARSERSSARWLPLALAAGLAAVLVGGGWMFVRTRASEPSVTRGDAGLPSLVVLAPRASATTIPRFQWRARPDAQIYRVHVYGEDGVAFGQVATTAAPAVAGTAVARAWPPGRYAWRVEALRDGIVVASSPLVDFELRR